MTTFQVGDRVRVYGGIVGTTRAFGPKGEKGEITFIHDDNTLVVYFDNDDLGGEWAVGHYQCRKLKPSLKRRLEHAWNKVIAPLSNSKKTADESIVFAEFYRIVEAQ